MASTVMMLVKAQITSRMPSRAKAPRLIRMRGLMSGPPLRALAGRGQDPVVLVELPVGRDALGVLDVARVAVEPQDAAQPGLHEALALVGQRRSRQETVVQRLGEDLQ